MKTAIYTTHRDNMVRLAERITGSNLYAEDIVQDVFMAFFEHQESFINQEVLVGYIYRSVYNKCIDLLRRKQLGRNYEDIYMEEYRSKPASTTSPMIYNELSSIVEDRIDRLPPKCRQIFIMKYRNEKTNPEISRMMGLSVKTIENQVFIARNVLRNYLQSYLCS